MYTRSEAESIAAALLDGGWSSNDGAGIREEYGFDAEELAQIVDCMARYEAF